MTFLLILAGPEAHPFRARNVKMISQDLTLPSLRYLLCATFPVTLSLPFGTIRYARVQEENARDPAEGNQDYPQANPGGTVKCRG